MTERLLQYIWQFKYFNATNLRATNDLPLQVIHPGIYNTNQGPDFLNAKIRYEQTTWAGSIELHIHSSEWKAHNHSADENYRNVILHVVWKEDIELGLHFPTLQLHDRVSGLLLNRYEELMQSPLFIPCQQHLQRVNEITFAAWKERLLIERMQQRALHIEALLKTSKSYWEETFWWLLAGNFGLKVNSDSFEKIAQSLPLNILTRHKNQLLQLEALLLGQAGLLDKKFNDAYPEMLRKEYQYLRKKYGLQKVHYPLFFLRMRPANFPTIRLAQLAALIHESHHLFSVVRDSQNMQEIKSLLNVTANDYWHYHYTFDESTAFCKKNLGSQMIGNILINTIIPVLYAYGYFNNNETYKTKALLWMEQVAAEKNSITKGFEMLGMANKNAFDSQSLIQLKNEYCNYKKCLQCAIGNAILKDHGP